MENSSVTALPGKPRHESAGPRAAVFWGAVGGDRWDYSYFYGTRQHRGQSRSVPQLHWGLPPPSERRIGENKENSPHRFYHFLNIGKTSNLQSAAELLFL